MTTSPFPKTPARSGQDGSFSIRIANLGTTVQIGRADTVYSAIRPLVGQRHARGCQHGGCGLCRIGILSGQVIPLGPMSRAKLQHGSPGSVAMLACRIAAATNLEIELGAALRRFTIPQS